MNKNLGGLYKGNQNGYPFRGSLYQKGYSKEFRGSAYQNGYGIGGYFRKFFTWLQPIFNQIKDSAMPHIQTGVKTVGNEIIKSASDIAKDVLEGKNIQDSAKQHISSSIESLASAASNKLEGRGYKSSRNNLFSIKKINKKRKLDIFD